MLQEACGLEELRHPVGAALYLEQARRIRDWLAKTHVTQRNFAPRRALSLLLREVLEGGERVEYAELLRRTERFRLLVMVRPDGYLVTVLHGQPIQRMGTVRFENGVFQVLRLVVGAFYFSHGGVLYPVDEALQRRDTTPLAEVGLQRDPLNSALDGAQDAMGELVLALAQTLLHPIQSVGGLAQLPTTVALLIASSPEYFARFGAMSSQDQIREAARLSTHLLMMYGGAAGTAGTVGRVGSMGVELPVLSLTAEGELVLSTVLVSGGTLTTTLGAGAGAVSILHMAVTGSGNWPPIGGPGQWVEDTTSMSERSRDYQAQVTGAPKGWCYEVCRNGECVEYDGYNPKAGTLLEAKGLGYDQWFDRNLNAKFTFKGLEDLRNQAQRQARLAGGLRVRWYVAEPRMVAILQKMFQSWEIEGIEVVYESPQA
ncbi:Tox-REase-5 domain-containing protein [Archangium sp.]|uniref:Tox-REase-5 domain-containing protein n=1 Tax=Archangium sp. TaxID=1872627 RepID=UPI00389AD249